MVSKRIQGMNRKTALRERPVHGIPEIGQSVEERSVHVKNNSFEIHDQILELCGWMKIRPVPWVRPWLCKVIWKIELDKVNFLDAKNNQE
jgi:hypothetical protein